MLNTEVILDAGGNITKWYTHIQAPTGICAVYEKIGTTTNFNYIHTDYLGSWLAVSNQSGSLTHHHSYDAC